jgi:hypothetical protein
VIQQRSRSPWAGLIGAAILILFLAKDPSLLIYLGHGITGLVSQAGHNSAKVVSSQFPTHPARGSK